MHMENKLLQFKIVISSVYIYQLHVSVLGHNPEVRGSKPRSAKHFFFILKLYSMFELCLLFSLNLFHAFMSYQTLFDVDSDNVYQML